MCHTILQNGTGSCPHDLVDSATTVCESLCLDLIFGMKSLITLLTVASLSAVLSACGGSGESARSSAGSSSTDTAAAGGRSATLPQIALQADDDMDSDRYPHELDNEGEVFGHPAGASDARAVTALVQRYYAVAARDDGAAACRLLYAVVAESVVEDDGHTDGVRGSTCASVVSQVLRQVHVPGAVAVTAVRLDLNRAVATFRFAGARSLRYIMLHRERSAWRIDMLVAAPQPIGVE
jgi:hypothetical protein